MDSSGDRKLIADLQLIVAAPGPSGYRRPQIDPWSEVSRRLREKFVAELNLDKRSGLLFTVQMHVERVGK